MTQIVVAQRMWQRRDTAGNWSSVNPVLAAGEIGVELGAEIKFKIGDGSTPWNGLAYFSGGGGGGGAAWHDGPDAPASSLGNDGDYYLRSSNGDVYEKVAGSWSVVANIKGPASTEPGPPGPPGPPGSMSGQISLGAGDRAHPVPLGNKALTPVTFACTILGYTLLIATSDGTPGSVSVDVRKVSFADFDVGRPNVGDTIVAAPLEISAGVKASGDASAWDVDVAENDILVMAVLSRSTNVVHIALAIETEKVL